MVMERLRPRQRLVFSGFTSSEIEKMEKLITESREELLNKEFCQKVARAFNYSAGRKGKPAVRWTEVRNWFLTRQQESPCKVTSSTDGSKIESVAPENHILNKELESLLMQRGEEILDASELEFEAKSSKDGAWYDVDSFLTHRFLDSGEAEVRVRFIGFGAEEDEWVNVRKAVRQRSIPYEHSECPQVDVGERVLCLQERRDQAIYYDARVLEIERKMHDIRGCRCVFRIRYDHDNSEASVSFGYQQPFSYWLHKYVWFMDGAFNQQEPPLFFMPGESSFEEIMLHSITA